MLQEVLANALKHVQASSIGVDLQIRDALTLTAQDKGVGIEPAALGASGTGHLRQRARSVDGSILV